jgi:hypothetical protein
MGQNYKEIAAIALKRREDAIPKDLLLPEGSLVKLPRNLTTIPKSSGHFTPEELEIMETNAEDILLKIKNKIWTSLHRRSNWPIPRSPYFSERLPHYSTPSSFHRHGMFRQ